MDQKIVKQELLIAGLPVWVFSHTDSASSDKPVHVHFFLHPRLQSQASYGDRVRRLLALIYEKGDLSVDVVLVTFDLRNHGDRMVSLRANQDWQEGNPSHAVDMYSIMLGSATDVRSLIDLLPSFLYPNRERHIVHWGVSGVSLGGHIVWLLLAHEPRLTLGVSVIGCPSYTQLIRNRAVNSGLTVTAPHIPTALLELVKKTGAEAIPWSSSSSQNTFLNKKVLIIAGGQDKLVPWSDGAEFIRTLEVGTAGIKRVHTHPDAAHEFTSQMLEETAEFIATNASLPFEAS